MTFRAHFVARSFPAGSGVAANGNLRFTEADLMHALFVTGRATGDEWLHGSLSLFEWLHRAAIVPAYLANVGGRVCRTPLADSTCRMQSGRRGRDSSHSSSWGSPDLFTSIGTAELTAYNSYRRVEARTCSGSGPEDG